MQLDAHERARGVIAMSAGNHAQAVAYQSTRLGVPSTIVMPENTPFTKVRRTQQFGARVVLHGSNLADASVRAFALAEHHGYTLVPPFDDVHVVAGQGT
ncbi:MAG: pyridoxal-phosphate dependent enzyme, partial [Candidatus Eremiobacteraeota bacterium]|nr:pyridoxal-phosphate dependent enzyme [Candidatus Eremiobacteraeota bacterium]